MKKLLISLTVFSCLSSYADCENAYKAKAHKRMKSNKTLATIALHVFFPPSLIVLTEGEPAFRDSEFQNNTFQKSLDMIQAAKNDTLSPKFLERMEKKLALSAYSDEVIEEMKEVAAQSIKSLNETGEICEIENGKISVLNFRKLSNLVMDKVSQGL